jgi:hypothetical protein
MSTPISSSSSGLQGAAIPSAAPASAGQARPVQLGALSGAAMLLPEDLATSLQAAASVNQFELAFNQVLQNATPVDPSTGQREISASADSQLSATLNNFLTENGFSAQQADTASANFGEQLAKGGPINLSATFVGTTANAFSVSAGYGSQTTSASGISVNERFGSVSIGFDPTTGEFSISLENQQMGATTSIIEPSAAGSSSLQTLSLPLVNSVTEVNSAALGGNVGDDVVKTGRLPAAQANETTGRSAASTRLLGLISELGHPTLHHTPDALDLLSLAARNEQTGGAAAIRTAGASDETLNPRATQATGVKIGFRQPLSIARHNLNGYGTTLFKRADGSTGAMSFEPTNIAA